MSCPIRWGRFTLSESIDHAAYSTVLQIKRKLSSSGHTIAFIGTLGNSQSDGLLNSGIRTELGTGNCHQSTNGWIRIIPYVRAILMSPGLVLASLSTSGYRIHELGQSSSSFYILLKLFTL